MSENYTTEMDYIYEPVDQFKNKYKDLHHQNSTKYIENLIEKSQVNVPENQETIKEIRKLEVESNSQAKQIRKKSNLKGFLIFLSIASIVAAAFSIYQITSIAYEIMYLLITIFGIILFVLFIVLIFKKINPKIKELKELKNKIDIKNLQIAGINGINNNYVNSNGVKYSTSFRTGVSQKIIDLAKKDRIKFISFIDAFYIINWSYFNCNCLN